MQFGPYEATHIERSDNTISAEIDIPADASLGILLDCHVEFTAANGGCAGLQEKRLLPCGELVSLDLIRESRFDSDFFKCKTQLLFLFFGASSMKRVAWSVAILIVAVAATVMAQPPGGGPGGRGGPPEGGPDGDFRPPPPLAIAALDVDRDHVLSAEEIKNAPQELSTLDRNKDGKLTEDEFIGPPPGGNRRGQRDGDVPQRRGRNANRQRPDDRGPPSDGPPGAGPRGAGGPPGDGPPGPPTPEQFVEHALQFDTDKDGKLSATSCAKWPRIYRVAARAELVGPTRTARRAAISDHVARTERRILHCQLAESSFERAFALGSSDD